MVNLVVASSTGLLMGVAGAAVVVILAILFVSIRNSIIGTRNRVDESWSGIDVQLKRRHDLVPNLVETVKGYAAHERGVLESVTDARANAINAAGPRESGEAEAKLSSALVDVRALAENYPQLRATENFQQLQRQLAEVEDQIHASRRIYNSNTQAYNTKIQIFPNSIVAGMGGFAARGYFQDIQPAEREPVSVSFS
jgi:LemA protein